MLCRQVASIPRSITVLRNSQHRPNARDVCAAVGSAVQCPVCLPLLYCTCRVTADATPQHQTKLCSGQNDGAKSNGNVMGQGRAEEIRLAVQDGSSAVPLALVLFGKGAMCPRVRHPADCSVSGVWGIPRCLPAGSCSRAAAPLCCYRPLDFSFCHSVELQEGSRPNGRRFP